MHIPEKASSFEFTVPRHPIGDQTGLLGEPKQICPGHEIRVDIKDYESFIVQLTSTQGIKILCPRCKQIVTVQDTSA